MRVAHAFVNGRVQGVGFRDWTARRALELGLDGWVRNRSDGFVETVLAGADADVAQLLEELWDGPAAAHVTDVEVSAWKGEVPQGFEIRATA